MALALLWAFLLAAVELLETVGMAAARRAGALIVVKVSAAAAVAVEAVAVEAVAVAAVAVAAVAVAAVAVAAVAVVVVVVAALEAAAAAAVATATTVPVDRANAVARCLAARFRWCGPSSCRRPCSARPQ